MEYKMFLIGCFANGKEYREGFAGAPQLANATMKIWHNDACMDPIAIEMADGTRLAFWDDPNSPYHKWILGKSAVPEWVYTILYNRYVKSAQ